MIPAVQKFFEQYRFDSHSTGILRTVQNCFPQYRNYLNSTEFTPTLLNVRARRRPQFRASGGCLRSHHRAPPRQYTIGRAWDQPVTISCPVPPPSCRDDFPNPGPAIREIPYTNTGLAAGRVCSLGASSGAGNSSMACLQFAGNNVSQVG